MILKSVFIFKVSFCLERYTAFYSANLKRLYSNNVWSLLAKIHLWLCISCRNIAGGEESNPLSIFSSTELSQFWHLLLVTAYELCRTELTSRGQCEIARLEVLFQVVCWRNFSGNGKETVHGGREGGTTVLQNQPFILSSWWPHINSPSWLLIFP